MGIQKGRCFFCNTPIRGAVEIDHFIPWARYRDNRLDNLVPAPSLAGTTKALPRKSRQSFGLSKSGRWDLLRSRVSIAAGERSSTHDPLNPMPASN